MKSNLPAGWETTSISTAFTVNPGHSGIDISDDTDVSFVPMPEIEEETGRLNPAIAKPYGEVKKGYTKFIDGDVLFAKITPCMENGKVAIASSLVNGIGCGTTEVFVFREKGICTAKYLFYYLVQRRFRQYAKSKFNGAVGHLRVPSATFDELTFPLPPLAEQCRIVAQLEATVQKLEASQERLEKLPVLLKKFRQSVLAAAVSGKLTEAWRAEQPQYGETGMDLLDRIRAERRAQWEAKQIAKMNGKQLSLNDSLKQKYEEPAAPDTSELLELPDGWVWAQVGEVFNKVSDGPFGSNLKSDDYVDEPGFQVIRLENIGWMEFLAEKETFISEEKFLSLEKHEVLEGDIIFSSFVSGNIRAVLLDTLTYRAINKADCFCLRDEYGLTCPEFLEMALSSEGSFNTLSSTVHGSTRPRINTTQLKALPIAIPPLKEQQEIVRQVDHYFELADQLEARFEQSAALVEQLPQALLAKAFSGQLVPQDPNDEPASALLERLDTEVAVPVKGKRGRKPKIAPGAPLFD